MVQKTENEGIDEAISKRQQSPFAFSEQD